MSRIGNRVLTIPANVTVTIDNNIVSVKGPKGELSIEIPRNIKVNELINVHAISKISFKYIYIAKKKAIFPIIDIMNRLDLIKTSTIKHIISSKKIPV
jgi:ribosomal protein L6P/L9E